MKKTFLYSIIGLGILILAASFTPQVVHYAQQPAIQKQDVARTVETLVVQSQNQAPANELESRTQKIDTGKTNTETVAVTLKVRNTVYAARVTRGSTILEMMQTLASTTQFRFRATYYSGMGYFVDEIQGIKNSPDAFWIYYVNGKQASTGISSNIVKPEDTIVWRFEDSNKNEIPY